MIEAFEQIATWLQMQSRKYFQMDKEIGGWNHFLFFDFLRSLSLSADFSFFLSSSSSFFFFRSPLDFSTGFVSLSDSSSFLFFLLFSFFSSSGSILNFSLHAAISLSQASISLSIFFLSLFSSSSVIDFHSPATIQFFPSLSPSSLRRSFRNLMQVLRGFFGLASLAYLDNAIPNSNLFQQPNLNSIITFKKIDKFIDEIYHLFALLDCCIAAMVHI